MKVPEELEIDWFDGERSQLRALFQLAEDSSEQIERHLPRGRVLVARAAGALVGHAQLVEGVDAAESELLTLAVAEAAQRRGIGSALVRRAVAECRTSGLTTLLVATATADIDNLRFYQRCGFRMLRVERDAFTPATGYPEDLMVDGIPLRDRVWLSMAL